MVTSKARLKLQIRIELYICFAMPADVLEKLQLLMMIKEPVFHTDADLSISFSQTT